MKLSALSLVFLSPLTLLAFDARYSPSEASVTWPASESPADKPALIFSHPLLGNTNILSGTVSVNDDERPFLARLDESGDVQWSKRLPFTGDDTFEGFSLVDEDYLIVSFNEGDPQVPTALETRIGSFNPQGGFAARYTVSLPPAPIDPLNPFGGGSRSVQAQRSGKVAVVEIAGTDANILLLDESGNPAWAKTYALPSGGGGSPFPIPGLGLSYTFVILSELENGDFYFTTNGADLLSQSVKAVLMRLNSSGDIIWQRTVDFAGTAAFVAPRTDESVIISGNGFDLQAGLQSSVLLFDSAGSLQFATSISNAVMNGFSFDHFTATGNILLQGSLATQSSPTEFLADGVALILDDTGAKLNEVAYDLNNFDSLVHIGTIGSNLYFELFGLDQQTADFTHGILAKSDANLENWVTRSYLEIAGPSANFSSFFGAGGSPYLTYRDADPNWINVNKLDEELQEIGDCEVLTDTTVVPYDPELVLSSFSPTILDNGVTVTAWGNPPTLTNDPFALEDSPFSVEFTCGNTTGGGGSGILTAGQWTETDFGWVFGLTEDWGISTYLSYVYVADFPYVFQVDLGWMYLVSSDGNNHIFYTWNLGYVLINEGFGGFYYVYATDDYTQQIPQP